MATLSGNAQVKGKGRASKVFVWHWRTGTLIEALVPDANGDWSLEVPAGEYGVTVRDAPGIAPEAHGPYEVE